MQTGPSGIALIKKFESFRSDSYRDMVGRWTVGWGCTHGVGPNQHITDQEGEDMLYRELEWVMDTLNAAVSCPLSQNQFDALSSFVYNVGATEFTSSTMLKLLNGGQYEEAALEFPKWDHGKGKEVPGLLRRRLAEQELFLGSPLSS